MPELLEVDPGVSLLENLGRNQIPEGVNLLEFQVLAVILEGVILQEQGVNRKWNEGSKVTGIVTFGMNPLFTIVTDHNINSSQFLNICISESRVTTENKDVPYL